MVKKHSKQLLIDALLQLLEEMPLRAIDVRDLTQKAGLSRQTFYYNFKNKQDMINWILSQNNAIAKEAFVEKYCLHDYFLSILRIIDEQRTFYTNVLANNHYKKGCESSFENGIISTVQEIELRSTSGRMNTEQWDALLFFAFGARGMILYWLVQGLKTDTASLADIIMNNMPPALRAYIDEFRKY